jgi:hypothetical protein
MRTHMSADQPNKYALHPLQLLLQQALHPPLHSIQVLSRSNVILAASFPARKRQIFGHDTILIHGVHTSLLQALGESHDFWRLVENSSLHESSCPGEDGGDGVGGGLVALLVLSVVAGDGSVGGFGFEGLAVGGDEDGGHEAQGAEALGYDVGLDVSVVVCFP